MATRRSIMIEVGAVDDAIVAFFEAAGRLIDAGCDGEFSVALDSAGSDLLRAAYLAPGQEESELEPIQYRLNAQADRRELLKI